MVFVGEKEDPFDLEVFGIFDTRLIKDFITFFWMTFWFEALTR